MVFLVCAGEKPFTCTQCKACTAGKLNCHMKIHTRERLFTRRKCSKQLYSNWRPENRSMIIHTWEKPFTCGECLASSLIKLESWPYTWKYCQEKDHLLHVEGTNRLKIQKGEKMLTCSECSKQFRTAWQLQYHMRMHTGEQPVMKKLRNTFLFPVIEKINV